MEKPERVISGNTTQSMRSLGEQALIKDSIRCLVAALSSQAMSSWQSAIFIKVS